MAELIGGSGYDDVQDTAPNSPSIGDTWLDTSTDPPTGKIYGDLGSGGQWTTNQLDANISSRATQSDILSDGSPFNGSNIDASISSRATPSDTGGPRFVRTANMSPGSSLNLRDGHWMMVADEYHVDGSNIYFEGRAWAGNSVSKYYYTDSSGTEHYAPAGLGGDIGRLTNNTGSFIDTAVVRQ